jgi:pimeloyl-[acyl-carrier protein] methyl ester esterase
MSPELYSDVKGFGKNVVLLHGWGMHGGVWGNFNTLLSAHCQTHALDLPGFGFSNEARSDFTLNAHADVVEEYIRDLSQPVILIGWSLGGLIALNILKRQKITLEKVVFIAATPCFTKKEGWDNAIEQSVFDDFSHDLKIDYKKSLKRFLSLQTRGSELTRENLRELNQLFNTRGEPNIKALEAGLKILSEADFRHNQQQQYETPAMLVMGEKDTLVPLAVKDEFEKIFGKLETLTLAKTGHAPFINNPDLCAKKIKNFISEE